MLVTTWLLIINDICDNPPGTNINTLQIIEITAAGQNKKHKNRKKYRIDKPV